MTVDAWIAVTLGGVFTFLLRASALMFAGHTARFGPRVKTMLGLIPPAVLSALVLPALVVSEQERLQLGVPVVAGLAAVVVGLRTKSIMWPLIAGMLVAVVL